MSGSAVKWILGTTPFEELQNAVAGLKILHMSQSGTDFSSLGTLRVNFH
jgi:hypothetical protein